MKPRGRYDVSSLAEVQFEPGSREQVLRNRLGITSSEEMDDTEARALERAVALLVGRYSDKHRFTAADICEIHGTWLVEIYEWAGNYRQVNLTRDDFPFAVAARVPAPMDEFERNVLARHTPCNRQERVGVVRALSEAHVELVLIHPFRDGNGRVARVLATLMALQAGVPLLNFTSMAGEGRQDYFAAVQAGLDRNFEPMGRLFARIIDESLASSCEAAAERFFPACERSSRWERRFRWRSKSRRS